MLHQGLDSRCHDRLSRGQQTPQCRFHHRLALLRRQVQDAKVLLVRRRRVLAYQRVICHAKYARRKQLLAIAVLGKRSRLAHQPVDDVPVVHLVLVAATQARQTLDQLLRVPHFQVFRVQPHLYLHADQPARHHVAVPLYVNQAALVHATLQSSARFQASRRQRTQRRRFLGEPLTPSGVQLVFEPVQKTRVLLTIGKISAAT